MKLRIKFAYLLSTEGLVCLFLLGAVFIPELNLPGYTLRTPFLGAPVIFLLYLMKLSQGKLQVGWQLNCLLLMTLTVVLSVLWGYASLGVPYVFGDFAETFKFLQFVPYVLIFPLLNSDRLGKVILQLIKMVAIYVAAVGLIQIVDPSGLGATIASRYTVDMGHTEGMSMHSKRILLTGTDPNVGAAIAVFFVLFHYALFRRDGQKSSLAMLLIFLVLLLYTQSRTALIGVLVSMAISEVAIGGVRVKQVVGKSILPLVIAAASFFVVYIAGLDYISLGLEAAQSGDNDSFNVRLDNMLLAYERFLDSPIFGWGPAGLLHSSVVDSEYAALLQRYGMVGILVFTTYVVYYIKKARKSARQLSVNGDGVLISRMAFSYIVFALVLMITNTLFSGHQLMPLVVLLSAGEVLCRKASDGLAAVKSRSGRS